MLTGWLRPVFICYCSAGVENVSDRGTIGPRKFLGLPENILTFRSKKSLLARHQCKFLVGKKIDWTWEKLMHLSTGALPHPGEMWGNIWRMIQDFVTNLPPRREDYHSLAGSLLFMWQIRTHRQIHLQPN